MKVAVAVWNDRISPVFDVSKRILVHTIEEGVVRSKKEHTFDSDDAAYKVQLLKALHVNTLICGAVSQQLADMIATHGIETISFVVGDTQEVIAAYLDGLLPSPELTMPGYGKQRTEA